ncbi:MAG: Holliday junction branch migration protein RuvA [Firmicutes bacterium]|nr:Holliday junction branch migration protein RuvA [Bacillota bacterium]
MYSYLNGRIEYQASNGIVIDVNNIGYFIYVPNPFSYEIGETYKVFVYNHLREDECSLYGFKTIEEKELFMKLINVKGMGPKVASGIFATGSIKGVVDAINKENLLYLTKFPKVGEKLAKQIILDLKGKLSIDIEDSEENNVEELISVLENLGYKLSEIKKIMSQIDASKNLEEQVKDALKLLLK